MNFDSVHSTTRLQDSQIPSITGAILKLPPEQRNAVAASIHSIANGETSKLTSDVIRALGGGVVKKVLLLHFSNCIKKDTCTTCIKLRLRRDKVAKRKKHWKVLRMAAKVQSVLSAAQERSAERLYAPGGQGALLAQESFNAKCSEEKDQ